MDYEIEWKEEAREDYRTVTSYLLDLYDFEIADRFTNTVANKMLLLEKTPYIGRKVIILNLLDSQRSIS